MKERDFLKIIIDLDGTILEEKIRAEKYTAMPLPGAIEAVNELYEMGHMIVIYSARTDSDLELTKEQLSKFGVKYHRLVLGKPTGDIFIDDRAFAFTDWGKSRRDLLKLISERMKQPFEEKSE